MLLMVKMVTTTTSALMVKALQDQMAELFMPNGEVLDRNGNVVGYIDANGKIHYTLPQTGENQSEGVAAAALGGAVVAIGLVSLVGVKKRHTN